MQRICSSIWLSNQSDKKTNTFQLNKVLMSLLCDTYIFIGCEVGGHKISMETWQAKNGPDGEEANDQLDNSAGRVKDANLL